MMLLKLLKERYYPLNYTIKLQEKLGIQLAIIDHETDSNSNPQTNLTKHTDGEK